MTKPTTGKVIPKRYRCTRCNHETTISTNHWGSCYPHCRKCSWKNPMQSMVEHVCLESCPETHDKPEPWKFVKLGDVVEIRRGKSP